MKEISVFFIPGLMILTAFLATVMVYLTANFATRFGMLDLPGERQSHTAPTPTGGGIGIIIALVLASLAAAQVLPVSSAWVFVVLPGLVLLSVVGWLDDRRPLSTPFRFSVQLVVSFVLLAYLKTTGRLTDWPLVLLGGTACVWVMNFYNFMDGSHGMAGFQGVFAGLFLGVLFLLEDSLPLAVPALLLAACCVGFLPLNFPVARIFMGDSGSVPLGFALSSLMVLGLTGDVLSLPLALLVLSVFLTDSTLTLLGRAIRGEQWYTAHKQHYYQRLIAQGWPHSRVLMLYQAVNLVLVVPVAILVRMYSEYAWPLTGMLYLLLISGWYLASPRLGMRK